jgi:hypothetical protein
MILSRNLELIAIILIFFLFASGCVLSREPNVTTGNNTQSITPPIPTITVIENNILTNDTYWIAIDPIIGYLTYLDNFNITARTNLPVDENVFIRISNVSTRAEGYEADITTGSVRVTNGNGKYNNTSYRVNSHTIFGSRYIVFMSAGEMGPSNVTYFRLLPVP